MAPPVATPSPTPAPAETSIQPFIATEALRLNGERLSGDGGLSAYYIGVGGVLVMVLTLTLYAFRRRPKTGSAKATRDADDVGNAWSAYPCDYEVEERPNISVTTEDLADEAALKWSG